MRDIIKVHEDLFTVPSTITKLMQEYLENGFNAVRLTPINFKLLFPDGWVHFYWEKGCIYQEIFETAQ